MQRSNGKLLPHALCTVPSVVDVISQWERVNAMNGGITDSYVCTVCIAI